MQLWSARYEATVEDVFSIQKQVATGIAEAIRTELGIADSLAEVMSTRYDPSDVRAYELIRKAVDFEDEWEPAIAVEAESPGLALRVEARALENGALGQVIRVENLTSRRRFLVEVTGERRGRVAIRAVGAGP